MSVRTMARVWDLSQHAGTDLLTLLAIADFADDEGNAYPSVGTLATKCRMKPRRMHYILKILRGSGELEVKTGGGPRGTNRYRITVQASGVQRSAGVHSDAGVQPSARGGALQRTKPLHYSASKPSLTIKNHQKRNSRDLGRDLLAEISEELFTDFAKLRKTQKAPITKTVVNGLRREADKAGITLEQVITMCCERGWRSFKADWLKAGTAAAGDKPGSKPWDGAR